MCAGGQALLPTHATESKQSFFQVAEQEQGREEEEVAVTKGRQGVGLCLPPFQARGVVPGLLLLPLSHS